MSHENPIKVLSANTIGTTKILNAALRVGARVLLASSSEVYSTEEHTKSDGRNVTSIGWLLKPLITRFLPKDKFGQQLFFDSMCNINALLSVLT